MSSKRYTQEFKQEAVKQAKERGHKVADVAARLGVSTYSLYDWMRKHGPRANWGQMLSARIITPNEKTLRLIARGSGINSGVID